MRFNYFSLFILLHGFIVITIINLPGEMLEKSSLFELVAMEVVDNKSSYLAIWVLSFLAVSIFSLFPNKPVTNHLPRVSDIDKLRSLTWREFEEAMAEYYIHKGYGAEVIGGSGGDGGIDLWLSKRGRKYIVQCKHWKNSVGVAIIREMFGVMVSEKASGVVIVTTSYFTKEAKLFAEGKPVELIDGLQLVENIKLMGLVKSKKAKSNFSKKKKKK